MNNELYNTMKKALDFFSHYTTINEQAQEQLKDKEEEILLDMSIAIKNYESQHPTWINNKTKQTVQIINTFKDDNSYTDYITYNSPTVGPTTTPLTQFLTNHHQDTNI